MGIEKLSFFKAMGDSPPLPIVVPGTITTQLVLIPLPPFKKRWALKNYPFSKPMGISLG